MKKLKENVRPLILLLFMPAMSWLYTLMNQQTSNLHDMTTTLDTYIPFVSVFVLPYMFWHAFIPLMFAILCFTDKQTFYKTMLIYVIGCTVANITFALFQTTLTRPILMGSDTLTSLVKVIYKRDNPVNCFPSIHVFTSYLMIRSVYQSKISTLKNNLLTSTAGILIIASTVLVKQHTVLDVISGIILAELLIVAVNHYEEALRSFCNRKIFFKHSIRSLFEAEDEEVPDDEYNAYM